MSNATVLLARRGIRARFGRLIAIAAAIICCVAFVVASFVLAGSLRKGFDSLFTDLASDIDMQARTELVFGDNLSGGQRDPIDGDLVADIADVPGVANADGILQRQITILDSEGDALVTGGAPMLGINWTELSDDSAVRIIDGAAPAAPDEIAMDAATVDNEHFEVGGEVSVATPTGVHTYTLAATIGIGDSEGFGGAIVVLFEESTAQEVLNGGGNYDTIDIRLDEGADFDEVAAAIADVVPANVETIDRETIIDESNESVNTFIGPFSTGLLVFAFITAFVSAFLINNVFSITIGQRLRELALLRAVGGAGRQVRRLIVIEALIVSVIATTIGVFAGMGVAKLLLGIFNSAGAGFPDMAIVLGPLAVVMAAIVGIGITLGAVFFPAMRASRIPPVAAMRPELGFQSLQYGRLTVAIIAFVIGAVAFLIGLLVRPGGTVGMIALAAGGALVIFLSAASLSSTIARPVTHMIGWPVSKLFGTGGKLAQGNAGRAPRRTAATASALMVGVALVSAASVFAAGIRDTFRAAMEQGVTADYVITGSSFMGIPAEVGEAVAELPEVAAASGVRGTTVQVDGETKQLGAANESLGELVNVGIIDGSMDALAAGELLLHEDSAEDQGVTVGDSVAMTFQNGETLDLTVGGIYSEATLAGNWLISTETLESVVSGPQLDFFVAVAAADGTSPEELEAAVGEVLEDFPQAELNTSEAFTDDQASQIDQLLVIITVLLGLSIIIAVLGISITLGLAVFERTREIGLMRAVGMTRRQTRRMVRWEAIIVSTFGAIIGIVLGTAIGVVLSIAVPDTIIEGVSFNPATIIIILVGAAIAGLVAALYPSFKASNMDVLEAIATE